ncbi:extracellular solute-binding protein [Prosthecomicrobium sp. N25]|uniref:extracellular solute-binding protein n=1 Tax=Prosthecomicrobium sp. N25 TaxID=3129254 RepID=UPI00307832E3
MVADVPAADRFPLPALVRRVAAALVLALSPGAAGAAPAHAIAMHGEPLYPAGFEGFRYARPDAPKGGRITYGVFGSFDSLNPFIIKGQPARGLRDGGQENFVYESMMVRGQDEAFTLYCLVCETVETPEDRAWVEFRIRPQARFSDGKAIEAADVVHSFELLRDEGRPNAAQAYKKVARVETPDPRTVRFVFEDASDKELALIMGLMPILPKHLMSREDFAKTSLAPPVGSGPYKIAAVDPGNRLTLKRDPNYWARDLAVKRGFDNFDEIRFDYYRDQNALFEAFKAGLIDVYPESDPSRWTTGYDFPAVTDGRIVKETFETGLPRGMYGFVFNTRRPVFADVRVREALARLFDFEWANKNLFFDLYRRTASYFEGSELSSVGRPASEAERKLLAAVGASVRPDILEGTWRPASTDGSGRDRAALKAAFDQLAAAGWKLDKGVMRNAQTGQPLAFEIIFQTRDQERIALLYQRTLKQIGIEAAVRTLDSPQYQRRRTSFDFDMTLWIWGASLSPGNEQLHRWSVAAADIDGSFNLPGARNPAHDALIAAMLAAKSRDDFVDAVRAFDRVLISGFYAVPLYHQPNVWLARWTRIERPSTTSLWGPVIAAWWVKPGS